VRQSCIWAWTSSFRRSALLCITACTGGHRVAVPRPIGEQPLLDNRGNGYGASRYRGVMQIRRRVTGFFDERDEQAERDRKLDEAESESELRRQIEMASSTLQAHTMNRFKAEWGVWQGHLERVQKESNETKLTPEILATIGDVPKPDTGGLTMRAVSNYRGFVRSYTEKRLLRITSNATITRNQRAFWESVKEYVDENLSSSSGEA